MMDTHSLSGQCNNEHIQGNNWCWFETCEFLLGTVISRPSERYKDVCKYFEEICHTVIV